MAKKKITLKDIIAITFPSLIHCSIVLDDGSFISEKYIGYKLGEAKKKFLELLKNM